MKFKFKGEDNSFCIELLAYKVLPSGSYLKNGQVTEVPDDLNVVINSLDASGVFERVQDKKVIKKENK